MYDKTCTCYVTFLQVCVRQYKDVRQDLHLLCNFSTSVCTAVQGCTTRLALVATTPQVEGELTAQWKALCSEKNNILSIEYLFMIN